MSQEIEWTRTRQSVYTEAGVTTAHDGATHFAQFESIVRASAAGANMIDVVCSPFIMEVDKVLAQYPFRERGRYKYGFKIGGVKITLDVLESTKMAGEPALMQLENKFAETLASVDGFHVKGEVLVLLRKGTVVARFQSKQ